MADTPDPWAALTPVDQSAPAQLTANDPWNGLTPLPEVSGVAPAPWLQRFKMGALDPVVGAGQLGAHLTNGYTEEMPFAPPELRDAAMGQAGSFADQFVGKREAQYQAQRQTDAINALPDEAQAYQRVTPGTDWARLSGNVASPANLATVIPGGFTGFAGGLLSGALSGASSAAMQPVDSDNYWGTKALQTGAGAVTGAALSPVAGFVAGRRAPDVQALQDAGVTLTPGQAGGRLAKATEAMAYKLPIAKNIAGGQQEQAIGSFNTALLNQVLKPIDEELPAGTTAGHDALETAHQKISDYYQGLMPRLSFTADEPFLNGIADVAGKVEQQLPPTQTKQFYNVVDRVLTDNIQGDALKAADSDLATFAARYKKSLDPDQQDLGYAVDQVRGLVRQQLIRSNPESAAQLSAADRAYMMLRVAERAAASSPTSGGVFTPAQVLAASRGARGATERQFAQGTAPLQPFAEAAQRVIGSNRGASRAPATASDIILGDLLGGGAAALGLGAAGAAQSGNGPDWLKYGAAAALPALMFTRPGAAMMRAFGPGGMARQGLGSTLLAGPAAAAGNYVPSLLAPTLSLPLPTSLPYRPAP